MTFLDRYGYSLNGIAVLLWPLSLLFGLAARVRRLLYLHGLRRSEAVPVPLIVVGNITVGGAGKTPLVARLVDLLREAGYQPGVISRGYGGQSAQWPQQVRADSNPRLVGDEPVLLARRCRCPIVVGPDRVAAARTLLDTHGCNVILSDDGLQHYRLQRDLEIAVVDGFRRLGNGACLPAGPLREPPSRLREVDFVVGNGAARGERIFDVLARRPGGRSDRSRHQRLAGWFQPEHGACGGRHRRSGAVFRPTAPRPAAHSGASLPRPSRLPPPGSALPAGSAGADDREGCGKMSNFRARRLLVRASQRAAGAGLRGRSAQAAGVRGHGQGHPARAFERELAGQTNPAPTTYR